VLGLGLGLADGCRCACLPGGLLDAVPGTGCPPLPPAAWGKRALLPCRCVWTSPVS